MNDIKTADFLLSFPPALKKDEKMLALGRLVAEELHITAWEAEKNIIYANIDSLTETWLDVLAYDLHVDWYDYDYPIRAKRVIIKDSVRVHQKLGTKSAVKRALGGIHPQSETEIEEWFTYNGKPYCFRVVLDTTNFRVAVNYDEIVKAIDIYKRLTAHLDKLYYQCSVCVAVTPYTEYFLFSTPTTGQLRTGTYPYRNIEGAALNAVVDMDAQAAGYITDHVPTGTRPYRSITFTVKDSSIVTDSDTKGYLFTSSQTGKTKAGTEPDRAIETAQETKGIVHTADTDSYQYEFKRCGANRL